ncbi:acyl carrier protein [Sphingobacterium sp.]|uniref:acyl carrier protein n=1 Tax=Sphingobacterium sp. TaxID=341027 RepID=UPI0028A0F3DE|nr:acyl carrier protein [Sphingobacterium sp.]
MNNTEKLHQAFVQGLSIPASAVRSDLAYQDITAWDSMSHLFLISALEDTFSIQIATEDILEMSSYQRITTLLKKYDVIL